MATPRWQRSGFVTMPKQTAQGVQSVSVPVHDVVKSLGIAVRRPAPTASQSGPTGSATAVGPSGDGIPILHGAKITCDKGLLPTSLMVLEPRAANVNDARALVNVPACGQCTSLGNPIVVAATAAARGALTPMPCTPATTQWSNGSSSVRVGGAPALHPGSTLSCRLGGKITLLTSS